MCVKFVVMESIQLIKVIEIGYYLQSVSFQIGSDINQNQLHVLSKAEDIRMVAVYSILKNFLRCNP